MIFWIWLVTVFAALVLYLRQVYSRFSRHGVKYLKPLPFLGNFARIILRLDHFADAIEESYKNFPGERFSGRYDFMMPIVVLRDLELVKKVTVKDFEYFTNHRVLFDKQTNPIFGANLFALQDDEWKDMRSTLSPAFTSSKIRLMVPFMVEVGDQMTMVLKEKIRSAEDGHVDLDVKDLTMRYANDVIASCAFGLKVDSHTDEENEFFLKGKETVAFKFSQMLTFFGYLCFPKIMNYLKVPLFSENMQNFFRNLVKDTMLDREEHHIIRPDMIHLLMQAKKGKLTHEQKSTASESDADAGFATVEESALGRKTINREWSDDDLVAQAVLFFLAGFETVSSVMSFLIHELAVNPDVQEKLAQEIREYDARNGGKFDFNSIQQMSYLDMVVTETLRLWPPAIASDRVCNKDYNLGKANDKAEDYIIRKGESVTIPAWAIHRDPEFYPDPLKFDPERFSEQNKHNINPFSYMPFGIGPRNCIASRFALCEVKVMTYQLLRSMELSPAAKTQLGPVKLSKNMNLRMEGGHWARLRIRN